MPQVFFSWTTPDQVVATRLRQRLQDAGIDVWEYTGQMGAGDHIPNEVAAAIDESRVAVFCLSDAAAERMWMSRELALCENAKRNGTMAAIMPVKVGALSEATRVKLGVDPSLFLLDESEERQRESTYVGLTQAVWEALGAEAPIIVPTALFAMNKEDYAEMRNTPEVFANLTQLCTAAGMGVNDLLDVLADRYDTGPEDFAPFYPRTPLVKLVHQAEQLTNRARIAAGKRPIFIRWCTKELSRPQAQQDPKIRDLWIYRNSLLIVDSVSALRAGIRVQVMSVPVSRPPARTAVVWVPPYTRHSAGLESWIQTLAGEQDLVDRFRDWSEARSGDEIAFDIGTSATLRLFLRRALLEVADAAPLPERLASIGPGVGFNTRNAF